jgi:hypothetical protein
MTVGRFIRNTFILTGVMLAVWAFLSGIATGVFGEIAPESQTPVATLIFFAVVLANVLVYEWYILRSNAYGRRLSLILFLLIFGVIFFMTQIETLVFNDAIGMPVALIIALIVAGVVVAGAVSPLAVRLFKKQKPESAVISRPPLWKGSAFELAWKLTALSLLYVLFYVLFGYLIAWQFPALREFYSGSTELVGFLQQWANTIKADPILPLLQIFRGYLWAGLALLATRTIDTVRRWERLTIVGLLMSIGLSLPILLPNPYLPAAVRYGHFPELFIENFLFGVIAGLLFTRVTSKDTGNKVD